ncbi:39S ribosomal protein L35, mitochondrial isoform X1 [Dermochelys coriacea]|uniref:39S ribosomal protein L35, mitochondrial isoform X1 n=2 Tax=Dermochelys coriacea TaxID=27794 RepID=UPI0018E7D589|nr:39S ribosomal protein L35, mitochondrial isoform X1 [Dermochelys coriacea]
MAVAVATRRLSGILRPLNFLVPLAYNSSCNIRLISGLSIRCFNWVQAPLASSVTKPLLPVSDRSCGCPLSIFNSVTALLPHVLQQPVRTLTYYSLRKGKRKSVKSVVYRFLRLHCGLWLRKKAGYKKKLWKKSIPQKRRLREQVFCNKTQSKLLDKMTTSFWKRRNWYVDDPFQKYHDRTNLRL